MLATAATVFLAALLGGGIATDVGVVIVVAAAGLVLIGLGNGVVKLADLCELGGRHERP